MPMSTGIARQAPSPTAQSPGALSQAPQSANGLSNGMLPNNIVNAGQTTDMNYLWGIVQELSDALAQNRAQTAGLIEQIRQMRQTQQREQEQAESRDRATESTSNGNSAHPAEAQVTNTSPRVNGEPSQSEVAVEIASLRSQLHAMQTQNSNLTEELHTQAVLNDDYVAFLNGIMERLRSYALSHSSSIIATHSHYKNLLEEERNSNLQLRIEHGEWQESLGRMAEWARKAMKERSEETVGMERRMYEVRAENRVLRGLLGWKIVDEESDEEDQVRMGGSEVSSNAGAVKRRSGLRGLARGQSITTSEPVTLAPAGGGDGGGDGDGGEGGQGGGQAV